MCALKFASFIYLLISHLLSGQARRFSVECDVHICLITYSNTVYMHAVYWTTASKWFPVQTAVGRFSANTSLRRRVFTVFIVWCCISISCSPLRVRTIILSNYHVRQLEHQSYLIVSGWWFIWQCDCIALLRPVNEPLLSIDAHFAPCVLQVNLMRVNVCMQSVTAVAGQGRSAVVNRGCCLVHMSLIYHQHRAHDMADAIGGN